MKRVLILSLALLLVVSFSACFTSPSDPSSADASGGQPTVSPSSGADGQTGEPSDPPSQLSLDDVGYKTGTPQDEVIAAILAASESTNYDYDDLSVPVELEVMVTGFVAEPLPDGNTMEQYVKEKLNIDLKLTCMVDPAELMQQISLRFASKTQPDVACAAQGPKGIQLATKLAGQGLILDDWTPYLKYIPTLLAQTNQDELKIRSQNGKLFGVPEGNGNDAPTWQVWIRQDWLDKLGIPMPTTPEELMAAAVRFTFDDPDGNGKDDTWGFSDCGGSGGGDIVWHLGTLQSLFNVPDLTLIDGKAVPRWANPNWKTALQYQNEMVSNKSIDPDWNTQDWQVLYNKLRAGTIGITYMWMPGGMTVMEGSAGGGTLPEPNKRSNGEVWQFEDWSLVQTEGYLGKGNWNANQYTFMISANAAKDETKLKRIFHYMEFMSAPNEGGVDFGLAAKPAGGEILEVGIGKRLEWSGITPAQLTNYRAFSWANMEFIQPLMDLLPWFAGNEPEFQQKVLDMQDVCREIPNFDEYIAMVSVPQELTGTFTEMDKFRKQAEIDFILGRKSFDEWDQYVDDLLNKMGGQQIIDSYQAQLKELGIG